MTTVAPQTAQLARLQWLLREAAKQSGIDVSDITSGKLALQMARLMHDNHMEMTWAMAPLDSATRCTRKAEIARFWYEKTAAEGWLLLMEVWNQQAREYLRMSAYGQADQ